MLSLIQNTYLYYLLFINLLLLECFFTILLVIKYGPQRTKKTDGKTTEELLDVI